jgi:tRNA-2-methylthio-N6-dimethylallyladenosine synthase
VKIVQAYPHSLRGELVLVHDAMHNDAPATTH